MIRSSLLVPAFTLVACGSPNGGLPDAPPKIVDSAPTDGPLDPLDVPFDGPGFPQCVADGTGAVFAVPGYMIELVASGDRLVQPVGLARGADGKLYVGNSRSYTSGDGSMAGDIVAIDSLGAQTIYAADTLMRGPDGIAFGPSPGAGMLGTLYTGAEDGIESGTSTTDYLVSITNGVVTRGANACEPDSVKFAPAGSAFGTDLYFSGRTNLTGGPPPNPVRLYRQAGTATPTMFTVTDTVAEVTGLGDIDWGHGGQLGTDLFAATYDDGLFSPGSSNGIVRVTAAGTATHIASGYVVNGLATSPSPTGAFGDFVYAASAGSIKRVTAGGSSADFVTGIGSAVELMFDGGSLYLSETADGRIRKITPCTP